MIQQLTSCQSISTFYFMDFGRLLAIVIAAIVFTGSLTFQKLAGARLLQFRLLLIYRF